MYSIIEKLGSVSFLIEKCLDNQSIESPIGEENISTEELTKLAIRIIKENPLSNPFPIKMNPNAEAANEATVEWIKRFKLIEDIEQFKIFKASKFINLSAGAYPNCDLERLSPIADWILFLYQNDDNVEVKDPTSIQGLNERKMQILKGESQLIETDEPLAHAVGDWINRIKKIANQNWIDRFLPHVDRHFQSTIWEAENPGIPDYEIYRIKRLDTGAVDTVLPLIELAEQLNIPEHLLEDLNDLKTLCNRIICDSNDIKSCPKEFEKKFMNNLVFVIKHKLNCKLEQAIQIAARLHNIEVDLFEQLKDELYTKMSSKDCDSELKQHVVDIQKYVEGMRYWMGSHFDFANKSARYNKAS